MDGKFDAGPQKSTNARTKTENKGKTKILTYKLNCNIFRNRPE